MNSISDTQDYIQGCKYRWNVPSNLSANLSDDTRNAAALAARFNISIPVIQVLLHRNYSRSDDIERFFFGTQEQLVSSPNNLKDASRAVDRIIAALNNKEKILICGDYDVDGMTSSALVLNCLLPLGANVNFFLPNRVRDGYGLSVKTVEQAARNNYKIIITVDNGITAFNPALRAKELGIDLIITDHHRPHDHVPDAYALINPHQHDCSYPFKDFAGVGVGFKLMSLLYERLNLPMPQQAYELLMLGTIADVVPLIDENRYWVKYGLSRIKQQESTALSVLKKNGRITKSRISASDIGFFITPQLNALGRLDDPRDGVKFLMSHDNAEVERIGSVLAAFNEARKNIEKSIVSEIDRYIKTQDLERERIIIASSTQWPTGVIGLVASRFVALYNRPTFLFHITADGLAKGSCRSIAAFNIFNALTHVRDLLITFGGHAAAAGLSLPVDKLPDFKERMNSLIGQQLTPDDFQPKLYCDAQITLHDITNKLSHDLSYLEPFGCANSVPLFYIKNVSLVGKALLFKEAHVKCTIFHDGVIKPVIFFNRPELFEKIQHAQQSSDVTCDLAVHILENEWNNETRIELQGIDIAFNNN